MADSDSTNAPERTLSDVASDFETVYHHLATLNSISNNLTCDWTADDDKETVLQMVERIQVLSSAMDSKLKEFHKLVADVYAYVFSNKGPGVTHV